MSENLPDSEQPHDAQPADHPRSSGAIWAGLGFIVLGLIFLAQNLDFFAFDLRNWWALFLLIPAFASFGNAWRTYQDGGNVYTGNVGGQIGGGLFFLVLAGFFLMGVSFSTFWPVLLIVLGISAFLSAIGR